MRENWNEPKSFIDRSHKDLQWRWKSLIDIFPMKRIYTYMTRKSIIEITFVCRIMHDTRKNRRCSIQFCIVSKIGEITRHMNIYIYKMDHDNVKQIRAWSKLKTWHVRNDYNGLKFKDSQIVKHVDSMILLDKLCEAKMSIIWLTWIKRRDLESRSN